MAKQMELPNSIKYLIENYSAQDHHLDEDEKQEIKDILRSDMDIISVMKEDLWDSVKDRYSLADLEKMLKRGL